MVEKKQILWAGLILVATLVAIALLTFIFQLEDIASIVQIVAGLVTTTFILFALVYGREIRESIKVRHLDGIRYVKDLIGTTQAAENRRWVYQELKKARWPLPPNDEARLLAICRDFDHIGFLCRVNLLPVEHISETYNRNIVDMWNRLERFIFQLRKERNDDDYFWEFEWLTRKAHEAQERIQTERRSLR